MLVPPETTDGFKIRKARLRPGTTRGFETDTTQQSMPADLPATQSASTDELIQRCLEGDQSAWDTLVHQHWRRVFNVAYKFVGSHDGAEDLTQEIFLKIFKSLHTFDRRANFQTWIVSISRNLCIDHYRSVRKERETIVRGVDAGELSPVSRTVRSFSSGSLTAPRVRRFIRNARRPSALLGCER